MEFCDSSPNYMRATSSFDAKKEISPGGSEYEDINSVTSSTCASAINSPYAPKLNNTKIKNKTTNKKTMKNFGSVKSFRRRAAKARIIQSHIPFSDEDSLLNSSETSSPNYLKATSCSEGKKALSQNHKSLKTLSRTSSKNLRNVRILIKRTSFKPKKRSSLNHPIKVSEDVSVDRATYSSTLKDSKFAEAVDLHNGVDEESEKVSRMKVCRYHHCSLHGHCHGGDDRAPPLKRFLRKKRQSMKKQKSMIAKKNLPETLTVPIVEPLVEEGIGDSINSSFVETNNELDTYAEMCFKQEEQIYDGDGYDAIQELGLVEVAFGEMSFPERSYRANVNIMRKYSYCLKCSCQNREQVTCSNLKGFNNEIPLKEESEASNKDYPETPIKFDEVTKKKSGFSSASYSRTSSDNNSEEEVESKTEFISVEDSKVNEVKDSETNSGKLQFSKPRHMSMWHLIHQHMSSNLATEMTNKQVEVAVGESPVEDGADSMFAKENATLSRDLSDSDVGKMNNDSEIQEIEIRKLFAIKLVREAIEKILLPEVQDQTSDDQSVTSESTSPVEIVEENQIKAHTEENYAESDADKGEGNVSSNPKEESLITDDASAREKKKETEKDVVRKNEKKAPKHWSNLKKWILLQRFIRELEKVRKFNPKKPQLLPLNPDPEAEKVNLRPQTVDERKNSEEWMLDYALRQAVNQLAPTQKRKVALLVKAFETVVPSQEDSQVQFRIPRLKDSNSLGVVRTSHKMDKSIFKEHGKSKAALASDDRVSLHGVHKDTNVGLKSKEDFDGDFIPRNGNIKSENLDSEKGELYSTTKSLILDGNLKSVVIENTLSQTELTADETEREERSNKSGESIKMERKNHIKMWHMIYQHVVSGIAERIGSQLLDGVEDNEVENVSPTTENGDFSNDLTNSIDESSEENDGSCNLKSAFTKSDALKLIKEAVDEILLPEAEDNSSDAQSVTNESISEHELLERNCNEIGGENISSEGGISTNEEGKSYRNDLKAESQPKPKNWGKLKKLILLKRSIRALEKARKVNSHPHQFCSPQMNDSEQEKIDLRRQMTDERKKAEQWMLDYAVQHIVTKLTPARKRRVSMLVEAFEAVVPLPDI